MIRPLLLILALAACHPGGLLPATVEGTGFVAIDGDTLRGPAGEHIRLARIDSPELPGHCRRGRHCAPGDPYAAQAELERLVDHAWIRCAVEGQDNYHRLLADCRRADGLDLGDWQLEQGFAILYDREGSRQ